MRGTREKTMPLQDTPTNRESLIFLIGCAISADSNMNNEEREFNIMLLKKIKEEDANKLSVHLKAVIDDGIKILEKEIADEKIGKVAD